MSHLFIDTMRHLGLNVPPRKDENDPEFLRVVGLALGGFHTQHQPDNFTDQLKTYRASALVYRCAQLWAESILQAPVQIFEVHDQKVTKQITSGSVWDVLSEVNGHISYAEWMYVNILNLALTGNSYTWKVRDRMGNIVELWPFRSDEIQISYDPLFDPRGKLRYEWRPFAGNVGGYRGVYTFKTSNILHLRMPSPISRVFGTAPLRAAAEDVLADQRAKKSTIHWLENEGVPAGVLTSETMLTRDQAEIIKQRWRDAHAGPERSGRIAVLGSGTKFTPIAVTPKDIEWLNQRKISRAGVLMAFGVPPIYAGMEGENFANRKEQRLLFWQDTIRPKLRLLEGQFTEFFLRDFNPHWVWKFDETKVDAFIEALAGRITAAVNAASPTARIMRPFEARQRLLGIHERFVGDDEWLVPGNMAPATALVTGAIAPQLGPPQMGRDAADVVDGVLIPEEIEEDPAKVKKLERVHSKQDALERRFARDLGRYFRFLSGSVQDKIGMGRTDEDIVGEGQADSLIPSQAQLEDGLLDMSEESLRASFEAGVKDAERDIEELDNDDGAS